MSLVGMLEKPSYIQQVLEELNLKNGCEWGSFPVMS